MEPLLQARPIERMLNDLCRMLSGARFMNEKVTVAVPRDSGIKSFLSVDSSSMNAGFHDLEHDVRGRPAMSKDGLEINPPTTDASATESFSA